MALIRYGHNDQKHYEPAEFKVKLADLCDRIEADYPGVQIILETNTWFDPEHYSSAASANKLNARMGLVWNEIRELAEERSLPLVDNFKRRIMETRRGNWDQRIRNQQLSLERFGERILDGSKDSVMRSVPNWFADSHPNPNGVRIIADEEYRRITSIWEKKLPVAESIEKK
jgi:lysophospholipase L1-like esterase